MDEQRRNHGIAICDEQLQACKLEIESIDRQIVALIVRKNTLRAMQGAAQAAKAILKLARATPGKTSTVPSTTTNRSLH